MNRVLRVARREFLFNVKRRSFLFTAFGLPLLIIGAQFAIGFFVEQQSRTTGTLGHIGYVDLTPDQILKLAVGKPDEFQTFADQKTAQAALIADEIGAYFVVPADYVAQGVVHAYGIRDIPRGIEVLVRKAAIDKEFRRLLLERRRRPRTRLAFPSIPPRSSC